MISLRPTFCFDVDGTICAIKEDTQSYYDVEPFLDIIERINYLYQDNHIILHTARGMKTHGGDLASINRFVKPILEEWLRKHGVKYHELVMGKPWGHDVRYIDDRSMTPDVFMFCESANLPYDDITNSIRLGIPLRK